MTKPIRFVADGRARAANAVVMKIREEVTAEFAQRLDGASFLMRFRLKREIKREIRRRIAERAPKDALY